MAKRQFQLNEQELEQFEQAEAKTRDTHELKRLQAVRLYGSGTERRVIETLVGCDERSIRKWAQKYQQAGLDGLRSHWQGENALKLSRNQPYDVLFTRKKTRPNFGFIPSDVLSNLRKQV